ncbi:thiamine-binding protein [Lacinutrix sp. Hel_I_90]|uniref:thiamine-binding protein n=1 Tax=Lacinutrix sp. Hel_I_90 TaxID=1249999 RepID=UPI0005CA35D9|nr:thiamine-binding protein [Lacinutrix sp. Hel_I_90]
MKISVELTLSPLQNEFEPAIIHFIKKLRASNLKVLENPLSTQVYGDYDSVMQVLNTEIKEAFALMDKGLLFMKIVKTDRHDYESHF